jgi:predicted MFS family arabinose efflux permease
MKNYDKKFSLFYVSIAGLALFFIGMGSCRFSYPPVMPLLISEHWTTLPQAGYLGSANFFGYVFGVFLAPLIGRSVSRQLMLITILGIAIASLALCALNLGFSWLFIWRLVNGIAGGSLMVLVPSLILVNTPAHRKAVITGIMFAGMGIGTIFLSEAVPLLNYLGGLSGIWIGFALITFFMACVAYPLIKHTSMPLLKQFEAKDNLTGSLRTALFWATLGYFTYGLAVTPYFLFLADYAHQALNTSVNISSLVFSAQGLGLMIGGFTGGFMKNWLGTYKSLLVMVVISIVGISLVLVFHQPWALGLSGFLIGATVLQVVMLMSLHVDDLVGSERHAQYWSKVTLCYASAQFLGGYFLSGLLALHLPYIGIFWVALVLMAVSFFIYLKMR